MKIANRSEITLEFLIKIALFAVVLILFVLPLVLKLYELIGGHAKPATINSMELLAKEIKYMEKDTVIPLYVDDKHFIQGFDIDAKDKPGQCKSDLSCLCTCKSGGCSPRNVEKCTAVEYSIGSKKVHLDSSFNLQPTPKVTNFFVSILGDTVSIAERSGIGTI